MASVGRTGLMYLLPAGCHISILFQFGCRPISNALYFLTALQDWCLWLFCAEFQISLSLSLHVVGAPRQRTLRHWPGPQDRRRCVCFTRRHCGGQAKNAVDGVCLSHDAGPVSAQHHQGFGS